MKRHHRWLNLTKQPVAGSIQELLEGENIAGVIDAGDSRSGATLERVEIRGKKFVLKRIGRIVKEEL